MRPVPPLQTMAEVLDPLGTQSPQRTVGVQTRPVNRFPIHEQHMVQDEHTGTRVRCPLFTNGR